MANNLTLIKKYIALLDEVYKSATLTADLESDSSTVRQGSNARTILIPKMSMDGLGDYSRKDGYVSGDVDLEWVEKTFNYDRGRRFSVDAMDNEETAALSFGKLASEFIRTKVVPEMEAWRFASYAKAAGTNKSEDLADGAGVCAAITAANIAMDEAEVPQESRILYITPTMYEAIQALDTYKSKAMLAGFAKTIRVPQTRFYSAIDLLSGVDKTSSSGADESAGGYKAASAGKKLNFLIVQKNSPIQFTKHTVNKVITPEQNQHSDAWMYFYRAYGITEVYDNKKAGIYASVSKT